MNKSQGTINNFFKPTEGSSSKTSDATKKRKLSQMEESEPKQGVDTKKRILNSDAKITTDKAKKEDVEEEKQHASTESESVAEVDTKKMAIRSGDCLASIEAFIGELGDWQEPLGDYLKRPAFKATFDFVKSEYTKASVPIYPPKELIFNAFKFVPFKDLKVVIVGQDPYIKEGEAMGLCFSIPKHVKLWYWVKCPPSLKNIYKALEADPKVNFKMPNPAHGDLSRWASQGVLLLNAILTVQQAKSNSHQKKGWEQFTDHVIQVINRQKSGVVFLLWGQKAHEKAASVDTKKHCVLKFVHPSPLAGTGFPACRDFSVCNEYLQTNGKQPIDWNV